MERHDIRQRVHLLLLLVLLRRYGTDPVLVSPGTLAAEPFLVVYAASSGGVPSPPSIVSARIRSLPETGPTPPASLFCRSAGCPPSIPLWRCSR
eukprot:scaffold31869_cov62-Phaeocystis_antarctica.AAC.2